MKTLANKLVLPGVYIVRSVTDNAVTIDRSDAVKVTPSALLGAVALL